MKRINFLFLLSCILFMGLAGCNDEFSCEGTLVIDATNSISDVWIYSLEDTTNPIYDIDVTNKNTYSIKLNAGNYQLNGYTDNGYLSMVTFQIRPEHTVTIHYDSSNIGKVSTE